MPLAGRDSTRGIITTLFLAFLLTRPLRDVTIISHPFPISSQFLLTRPLLDVTQDVIDQYADVVFLLTRPLLDVTRTSGQC